jgi:hypothetical protein
MSGTCKQNRFVPYFVLALVGCGCPDASHVNVIDQAGGRYVGGFGQHGACGVQWLWFDSPVDDEEFARLTPALSAMSPKTLQLNGQVRITDRSVGLINQISGVKVLYLDGSGISRTGLMQLRPDIRVEHGAGYR